MSEEYRARILEVMRETSTFAGRIASVKLQDKDGTLINYLIESGFAYHNRYILYDNKKAIKRQSEDRIIREAKINRIKRVLVRDILTTWRMSTGKMLGDVTRPELFAEAARDRAISNGLISNVDFYLELASNLKDDITPISDALPSEQVERIKDMFYKIEKEYA